MCRKFTSSRPNSLRRSSDPRIPTLRQCSQSNAYRSGIGSTLGSVAPVSPLGVLPVSLSIETEGSFHLWSAQTLRFSLTDSSGLIKQINLVCDMGSTFILSYQEKSEV